jgi:hypothetical protein
MLMNLCTYGQTSVKGNCIYGGPSVEACPYAFLKIPCAVYLVLKFENKKKVHM